MRILAFASLCFVAMLTATASLSPDHPMLELVEILPGQDFTAHFLLIGMTTLASTLAFAKPSRSLRAAQLLPAAALLLAATGDEFSQMMIRSRTFSLTDLAANCAGVFLFSGLGLFYVQHRARRVAMLELGKDARERSPG